MFFRAMVTVVSSRIVWLSERKVSSRLEHWLSNFLSSMSMRWSCDTLLFETFYQSVKNVAVKMVQYWIEHSALVGWLRNTIRYVSWAVRSQMSRLSQSVPWIISKTWFIVLPSRIQLRTFNEKRTSRKAQGGIPPLVEQYFRCTFSIVGNSSANWTLAVRQGEHLTILEMVNTNLPLVFRPSRYYRRHWFLPDSFNRLTPFEAYIFPEGVDNALAFSFGFIESMFPWRDRRSRIPKPDNGLPTSSYGQFVDMTDLAVLMPAE